MKLNLKEVFPTKTTAIVFTLYICLFVNQGILVTVSQNSDKTYNYNVIAVVLTTDIIKLVASACLYCRENRIRSLWMDLTSNKTVFFQYFIPASLYCIYNNLSYWNLTHFDPTTYTILLQLRVVVTGILFQAIFQRTLTRIQWLSLMLLTIGCMMKQLKFPSSMAGDANTVISDGGTFDSLLEHVQRISIGVGGLLIGVQLMCSCLAGVYNEYLLKTSGADVNIFVQNVFMYVNSILCNVVVLLVWSPAAPETSLRTTLQQLLHYKVLLIMLNNAAGGIVTSFFLKSLNSIMKSFANGLEIALVAILSYIVLRIPIDLITFLSITVVIYSIYLYSQNPVINANVSTKNPVMTHDDGNHYQIQQDTEQGKLLKLQDV